MSDLLPNPWHLVVPGSVLAVACGSTVEGQTRVRSRWLASCEACLTATEPCKLSEAGLDRLLDDVVPEVRR